MCGYDGHSSYHYWWREWCQVWGSGSSCRRAPRPHPPLNPGLLEHHHGNRATIAPLSSRIFSQHAEDAASDTTSGDKPLLTHAVRSVDMRFPSRNKVSLLVLRRCRQRTPRDVSPWGLSSRVRDSLLLMLSPFIELLLGARLLLESSGRACGMRGLLPLQRGSKTIHLPPPGVVFLV